MTAAFVFRPADDTIHDEGKRGARSGAQGKRGNLRALSDLVLFARLRLRTHAVGLICPRGSPGQIQRRQPRAKGRGKSWIANKSGDLGPDPATTGETYIYQVIKSAVLVIRSYSPISFYSSSFDHRHSSSSFGKLLLSTTQTTLPSPPPTTTTLSRHVYHGRVHRRHRGAGHLQGLLDVRLCLVWRYLLWLRFRLHQR